MIDLPSQFLSISVSFYEWNVNPYEIVKCAVCEYPKLWGPGNGEGEMASLVNPALDMDFTAVTLDELFA